MKARAISGYGNKGPACFLVEIEDRRLLLDLGAGPDEGRRPDLAGIGQIDAVLISHSHADHTGALDMAAEIGNPPLYMTGIVAELVDAKRHGETRSLPLEGVAEVLGLEIVTGRDGHAPGGIWMRIGGPGGVLYTGDFSTESALYPFDPFVKAAHLIFDASYGAYDAPLPAGIDALVAAIGSRPALLPAPAGGRGLEMAMRLGALGHRISLDALHVRVGRRLIELPGVLVESARDSLARIIAEATTVDAGAEANGITIAANANGSGGTSRELIANWVEDAGTAMIFTGHRAAGTPAATLVDSGRAQFVRWNVHPRLGDMLATLDAVRPERAMPAFLARESIAPLVARLGAGHRFVEDFA